ncbi:hypothetical protein D3C85_1309630 [compost metagenome]
MPSYVTKIRRWVYGWFIRYNWRLIYSENRILRKMIHINGDLISIHFAARDFRPNLFHFIEIEDRSFLVGFQARFVKTKR